MVRVVRAGRRVGRLLEEALDQRPLARLDHPELRRPRRRHPDRRHGDAGPGLDVLLQHLARVHPVDVVGAEHADVVGRSSPMMLRFWKMASAEPANHCRPRRIWAGTGVT